MITQMYPPATSGLHHTPTPAAFDPTQPDCVKYLCGHRDTRVVWVDGHLFSTPLQAAVYIKRLGFTEDEAVAYIRALPVRPL